MRWGIACLVTGSVVLSGCSSVTSGFVNKNWSENIRELNIYPLFPPSADVYIGDAFATSPVSDDHKGFAPLGTYLLSVDAKSIIADHYANRGHFGSAGSVTSALPPETRYLRQVGFPFFVRATVSGGELGAFLPFDALKKELALGANSVKSASVSISTADVQRVPMLNLIPQLWKNLGCVNAAGKLDRRAEVLGATLAWSVPRGEKPDEQFYDITFINEVYYARTFDVTLHLVDSAGVRAFQERNIRIPAAAPAADTPEGDMKTEGQTTEGAQAATTTGGSQAATTTANASGAPKQEGGAPKSETTPAKKGTETAETPAKARGQPFQPAETPRRQRRSRMPIRARRSRPQPFRACRLSPPRLPAAISGCGTRSTSA